MNKEFPLLGCSQMGLEERESAPPRENDGSLKAPTKHKILVVDDEIRILELLRRQLGKTYKVFIALSGAEALQLMERESIDLVIADQRMPGMTGTELMERIRECYPETVRILLTGYTDLEGLVGAINRGRVYRYIAKPWEPEELKIIVKQSMEHFELKAQNRALVDDLRKQNLEFQTALEKLKALDKAKDAFFSSVSHELRTPLTAIRSFSEILLDHEDIEAKDRREFLGIIKSESERLTRLIEDVLDLSKIESGMMVWKDEAVSLESVAAEISGTQQPLFQENQLKLVTSLPSDLPPVFADRDRIRQVLMNLISNGVKFSLRGGEIRVQAEVFTGKRAGENPLWIKVSVADQGVGIEGRSLERIFDKFNQGDSDPLTDKPRGTGLGLPICKEIINHYGGRIWAESRKGEGSTFFFTLPACNPDARLI